jgi:hypothetical protein
MKKRNKQNKQKRAQAKRFKNNEVLRILCGTATRTNYQKTKKEDKR